MDVYQDLDTGNIRVEVEGGTGKNLTAYDEGLSLEYKAGEVIEEGKHAGKKQIQNFQQLKQKRVMLELVQMMQR